jgi:hypothetical protein
LLCFSKFFCCLLIFSVILNALTHSLFRIQFILVLSYVLFMESKQLMFLTCHLFSSKCTYTSIMSHRWTLLSMNFLLLCGIPFGQCQLSA